VLIDGGPDGSVLRALGASMPPWDRSLDVVIATSADADDVSGLVDVLQRYTVGTIIQSGVENSTPVWSLFEKEAADGAAHGTKIITARRGQVIDLGKGAYIEILSPDRVAPGSLSAEGCVVARLVYGKTSFMLPCDAPQGVENYLAMLDGTNLKSDVLMAGHNGAKTSSSPVFVGYVAPQYAVYSRGCDAKFSPATDTVATFAKFNVQTLDTCTDGTIAFVSDGQTVSIK
jgi:competence protein ComEC